MDPSHHPMYRPMSKLRDIMSSIALSSNIGNAVINDETDSLGMIDYLAGHAIISDHFAIIPTSLPFPRRPLRPEPLPSVLRASSIAAQSLFHHCLKQERSSTPQIYQLCSILCLYEMHLCDYQKVIILGNS
ncbi:unnamed protein product [Lupinus luteus]|uniref:Uncharacterized protein n=1 Tax=Lupinus luteus TaxID=3873 RepID=A0AAV1WK27_LUPLU